MMEKILPYNKNDIFLGASVDKSISIVKKLSENSSFFYDKEDICNLINVKSYLVDENILEFIEGELDLKKTEILVKINKVVGNWLKINYRVILEKNKYWIEDSLWREMNSRTKQLAAVSKDVFRHSLFQKNINLSTCLKYKYVVRTFSDEIADYLFKNIDECIDTLLEKYENRIDDFKSREIYLPTKFMTDYEDGIKNITIMVSKFVSGTNTDDFYRVEKMRLLSISRNMELNTEIKYLAKKKYEEINDNYFEKNTGFSYTFGVTSSPYIEYKKYDARNKTMILSDKWVKENDDFKTRFIFNTSTFLEFMNKGRLRLDPLMNPSLLTSIFTAKGRDEYPVDHFTSTLPMYILSLMIYEKMLATEEETLELLLNEFYNTYIVEEFGYDSFDYIYNDEKMSYKSKTLLLLPVFDYTLKKIEYFLEHKSLNLEYLDFDDNTVNYRTIKSSQKIKNVYLNPENKSFPFVCLHYQSNHLYIDQESVSVFDAIEQEKIRYLELENQNKSTIDAFIEIDCLEINENGIVIFTDKIRAEIYKELYLEGELIYYHYNEDIRRIIDEDIDSGKLIFDNNFLSKRESNRYSYIMDKQLYSNGLNLRNKYAHKGAVNFNDSEMQHQQNYFTVLMLFIQVTLKFNLELCMIYDLEGENN